jgi:hypothetical protein
MPEFLQKPIFTVNGMTLTVGMVVIVAVLAYVAMWVKNR